LRSVADGLVSSPTPVVPPATFVAAPVLAGGLVSALR
jgi:hypothetical protein